MARILIIQGHPDRAGGHLCHALADAYEEGARAAGHRVECVEIARLGFPLLRTKAEFEAGAAVADIVAAQDAIRAAEHLVIVYPLWLGSSPALLNGFLEQVLRPGFAVEPSQRGSHKKLLKGRSARIVVTMGMPALFYRWFYGAHTLRNLKRGIFGLCGIGPCRHCLIGMVEGMSETRFGRLAGRMRDLGERAS